MTKTELLKHIGSVEQIGGIKDYTFNDGKAKGVRAIEINTGKIRFTVLPDRCMDIAQADIEGIPVKFGDTAGIRESEDVVESIGVEKSYDYIKNADICIFVKEAGKPLTDEEKEILEIIKEKDCIFVANKTDLCNNADSDYLSVSAKDGKGIDKIKKSISKIIGNSESTAFIANERQFEAVVRATESIKKAKNTIDDGFFSDLCAIDIEEATAFLGEAEGISINQETVNRIFEKFCLGK